MTKLLGGGNGIFRVQRQLQTPASTGVFLGTGAVVTLVFLVEIAPELSVDGRAMPPKRLRDRRYWNLPGDGRQCCNRVEMSGLPAK